MTCNPSESTACVKLCQKRLTATEGIGETSWPLLLTDVAQ